MSHISGLLGTAGGINGSGIGSQNAGIMSPVTQSQANQSYHDAAAALAQQRAFAEATRPGGLQALQSQQGLLAQLQQGAQGQGPNPALAQLNQTTGQNVANQAALMAGQRGANSNPALMARQAAMQGANTQQNAVGQAATLSAQQQQAYMQQLAAQQQAMVGQQAGATSGLVQGTQGEQSNLLNSIAGVNSANVGQQANMSHLANTQMQGQQAIIGGIANGAGKAAMPMAEGGQIGANGYKGVSPTGQILHNIGANMAPQFEGNPGAQALYKGLSGAFSPSMPSSAPSMSPQPVPQMSTTFSGGGKVPALVSPGETYLPLDKVSQVQKGANPLAIGERIPGQPKYKGNNYANDTVRKDLDEGGIVIPNSIMQSKDAAKKAAKFVEACLAKNRSLPKKSK